MKKLPIDVSALSFWFEENKRLLPWRENPTPYAVWVSEVMLQQTQVAVVIGYFQRWMTQFPTISDLAAAPLEAVIKCWEGLGYYARARNLHRGAQYLVAHHGGALPNDRKALEQVAGLGPYTIGAILSFAFHQKAAAVDGNVVRVLSRYTAFEEVVCERASQKQLWDYAERILPDKKPWVVVEALIELGATVCMKQPQCDKCPLADSCEGKRREIVSALPRKKQKVAVTYLRREVAVIEAEGCLLVRRGERGKLMQDLYEFPYFDSDSPLSVADQIKQMWGLTVHFHQKLSDVTHTFTRYKAHLFPVVWKAEERIEIPDYHWISYSELNSLPFSAGHRKILQAVEEPFQFFD